MESKKHLYGPPYPIEIDLSDEYKIIENFK